MLNSRRKGPFAEPGFRWLWGGQLVGLIGDQIFPMAIVAMLSERSGMALSLGLVFGARFAGLSLLIIATGVLADRLNKTVMLLSSNVIRFSAVIFIIAMGGDLPLWALMLTTFLMGAGEAIFQPAYDSTIPSIVPATSIEAANAATNMLRSIAQIVGPGMAGLVVTGIGATSALTLNAATFLVATSCLLALRRVAGAKLDSSPEAGNSLVTEALEGFRVVFSMRWLFTLEIMSVVHVLLAVGPWFILLPLVATNRLGGLQSYGLVLSAFALGGLAGAALAGSIGRRTQIPGVWGLIGLSLFGVACLSLALPIPLTGILALAALGGAGTQFFDVLKTTAMQKEIPKGFLGRVFAVDFFASFVMMPAGQMLAGLLITSPERANTAAIFAAVVIFSTTLLPLFARSVRHLSNQSADDRVSAAGSIE
ncbi:MFS transporter [Rhodococcus sp. 1168]|uniref:MFS transporter n=1 Tax=Rhodococcus sp. 1168 TaxID=2018041 RepID=UPI000A0A1A2F|nr:MFS transporter [Rhodococcus sp. 1168]ORI13551.1 hypothetical protein BJI47_23300 [Rhodococcus sp. 1168]